jgi:mRNA-degrading endonuclease HigB of HigAB toxin-antitoxin module
MVKSYENSSAASARSAVYELSRLINIAGNKFRLITFIVFAKKRVFIRDILTHEEYNKGKWKE